jgi:hypothetical protein
MGASGDAVGTVTTWRNRQVKHKYKALFRLLVQLEVSLELPSMEKCPCSDGPLRNQALTILETYRTHTLGCTHSPLLLFYLTVCIVLTEGIEGREEAAFSSEDTPTLEEDIATSVEEIRGARKRTATQTPGKLGA